METVKLVDKNFDLLENEFHLIKEKVENRKIGILAFMVTDNKKILKFKDLNQDALKLCNKLSSESDLSDFGINIEDFIKIYLTFGLWTDKNKILVDKLKLSDRVNCLFGFKCSRRFNESV